MDIRFGKSRGEWSLTDNTHVEKNSIGDEIKRDIGRYQRFKTIQGNKMQKVEVESLLIFSYLDSGSLAFAATYSA